uniref:Large ribosomal subunit protein uL24c n=1 Tax=Ceramothamnion japonicum TaxID=218448 RepID=A0A1C9CDP0_CERJP|nr:ribosomal protein L24 [Ceramium japonicum]AOM66464.1 ribosomal protein L24 [Ceramium japonicum]
MKIKKQDTVIVITGKHKGKQGKVLKVLTKTNQVIIEKINLKIKHIKPKGEGKQGERKTIEAPIHISNITLVQS